MISWLQSLCTAILELFPFFPQLFAMKYDVLPNNGEYLSAQGKVHVLKSPNFFVCKLFI